MSRAQITLRSRAERERAVKWIGQAPTGTRVEFKAQKRTLPQNDKMWAMLSDVARQLKWHDKKLTTNEWKSLFLDALDREAKLVPSIDGTGLVNIGNSSSDLGKHELADLLEVIACFGAEHGVVFTDPFAEAAE